VRQEREKEFENIFRLPAGTLKRVFEIHVAKYFGMTAEERRAAIVDEMNKEEELENE